MSDRYLEFANSPLGKSIATSLGLPAAPRLRRAKGGYAAQPLADRAVLLGGTGRGELAAPLLAALHEAGAAVQIVPTHPGLPPLKQAAAAAGIALRSEPGAEDKQAGAFAYVFDATGLQGPASLRELYDFYQPRVGRIPGGGRVLLLSRAPEEIKDPAARAATQALRGFVRSLAKEVGKKGITVNLLELGGDADPLLAGPLRFFLSEHSAFVTGQVLALTGPFAAAKALKSFTAPLSGKIAVVTGAARGIGAAIAATLAREGAQVVGIDRPQEEGVLGQTLAAFNGLGLPLDITAPDAPARIVEQLAKLGGADIVVHNAGITRDKMLKNMPAHFWDQVLDVNFGAILRINERLLASGNEGFKSAGRMVCISSIGGIGGNAGQTNYGATKAGVIGYVEALAPELARRGGAINAVAPGFIETQMTAAMPAVPREVGRRLSSLGQGGLPVDIAEAVTFFASPLAAAANGCTLRVCGQNFFGA